MKHDIHMQRPSFIRHVSHVNQHYRQGRDIDEIDRRFLITRSKIGNHNLLEDLGLPHAHIHEILPAHDLKPAHLKYSRTLKPLGGAASIGVMVLDPQSPGRWREARTGDFLTFKNISMRMNRVMNQYPRWGDQWMLEERLYPPSRSGPIHEYRVFIFGGDHIELITCIYTDKRRSRRRWWTADWRPVDPGQPGRILDKTLPLPPDPDALSELARNVAHHVPFAFARVDIFTTARGLVVGEINDHIGHPVFSSYWDERLGSAWTHALESGRYESP